MQEEEKDQEAQDQAPEEPEAPEEAAPAEPEGDEPAAEEAGDSEGEEAAEPAAEPETAPVAADAPEVLTPKQRRKQARSRASGPPGPARSLEDRLRERTEARARKTAERRRWRTRRREKKGPGTREDTSAQPREPGKRKVRQGLVVSNKGDKTITVQIESVGRHRVYGKVVRATGTLHVHDERNKAQEGDVVRVMECRPLSRTKRWRLVDVLEKAK